MCLLDTLTGHFVEFYDTANIRYAILSHTWDPHCEQTYQDVREIQKRYPIEAHGTSARLDPPLPDPGASIQAEPISSFWNDGRLSEKVRKACEIARSHGFRYLWIDSCCIDKTSSSELSEAINSMYTWYGRAAICYAYLLYLADVPQENVPDLDQSAFRKSRWFKRGWTLQKLIAPKRLVFLSRNWQTLGSKSSMVGLVEQITRIDHEVLTSRLSLDRVSVAQRMSWAAERETTRVEDRAYSLLGIFNLHMPTLYGEGERAFWRLQEEILRRIPDQSLFALSEHPAWPTLPIQIDTGHGDHVLERCMDRYTIGAERAPTLLGSSPSNFVHAGSVDAAPQRDYLHLLGLSEVPYPDYSPSAYGIRLTFPIIPLRLYFSPDILFPTDSLGTTDWYLVVLRCYCSTLGKLRPHLLACACHIASSSSSDVAIMTLGSINTASWLKGMTVVNFRKPEFTLFTVTADQLRSLRRHVQVRSVYLPYPDRASSPTPSVHRFSPDRRLMLALSSYTSTVLQANGYEAAFSTPWPMTELFLTHSLLLRRRDRVLQINIDEIGPPVGWLSAAAWSFAVAEVLPHGFPLSTGQDPPPHDAVAYGFGGPARGFSAIILSEEAAHSKGGMAIRLELEEAPPMGSSVSHYLHVDIEELRVGDYDMPDPEQYRGASVVQQLLALRSQAR